MNRLIQEACEKVDRYVNAPLNKDQIAAIAKAFSLIHGVLRKVEDTAPKQTVFELSMSTGALETLLLREKRKELWANQDSSLSSATANR
jgi:hypothetical protein